MDFEMPTFSKNIKNYICNLDDSMCDNIKELLREQNYGELNKTIISDFDEFRKKFNDRIDEIDTETDEKLKNYFNEQQAKAQEKGDIKVLKFGLPSDMIRNRNEIAKRKAEAASEKKNKKNK